MRLEKNVFDHDGIRPKSSFALGLDCIRFQPSNCVQKLSHCEHAHAIIFQPLEEFCTATEFILTKKDIPSWTQIFTFLISDFVY